MSISFGIGVQGKTNPSLFSERLAGRQKFQWYSGNRRVLDTEVAVWNSNCNLLYVVPCKKNICRTLSPLIATNCWQQSQKQRVTAAFISPHSL